MGIVPAIRREKKMNAEFFPLFIGTHDKTVLQLIQMLLSGILMGLKCNQNTHKKSRKCFQLPFWFPIYFYSWNEGGTWKNILDLIKNAPRCKRQKRTISTDCITDYDRKKMHGAQLTVWFIWHHRNEQFSTFNKNEHGFFFINI